VAEIILNATIRTETGRTTANALRNAGRVPGIYYMHTMKNIPISVHALDLRPLVYTSDTHIVDLRLDDGTTEKCVIREVQFDPVTDKIVHFDLIGLVMSEKMEFEVPIVLEGVSIGVREGGFLNHLLHRLHVRCLPAQLPVHIMVDITNLKVGEVITVGDLNVKDIDIHDHPDVPVVTVAHHRGAAAVETPAAERHESEESEEPEVITKGKTSKEGE
jgi:large subunit ribosomal protein L25